MLKVNTKTDIGMRRDENQDRVWANVFSDDACAVIVCDGMGGENSGSEASDITVHCLSDRIMRGFRPDITRGALRNLMLTSVNVANTLVYSQSVSAPQFAGMGTTCVCCIVTDMKAHIISVGDSRAYHFFGNCAQQVTQDHTYVQRLVELGRITEEESRVHAERNYVMRAIGAGEDITPDYFEIDLSEDSSLIFCTDGLHGSCSDEEIADIAVNSPASMVCEKLVAAALAKGGADNITVASVAVSI